MRGLIRSYLTGAIALYCTTRLVPGFTIEGSFLEFALIAILFTIAQKLVKPLISLLLLPLHFLTLGTVAWIVNLLILYGLTFFVAKVHISGYYFAGLQTPYFVVPALMVTSFMAALLASLSLGIIGAIFHWVLE